MASTSAWVALGPAIAVARSPDRRVRMKARVITVAATSSATISRRTRKRSMSTLASLVWFVPERDHANPAPDTGTKLRKIGEQSHARRPWRARLAPIWGKYAGLHQPAAHALLQCCAYLGRHRGDRRRSAGDDPGGIPPPCRQRAHPGRR